MHTGRDSFSVSLGDIITHVDLHGKDSSTHPGRVVSQLREALAKLHVTQNPLFGVK